ncbi:MAG: hypothetical protein F6K25_19590 [Okeania sp. SIO2G4]|uniref:DUF6798 domain-containing protein n=1 Tax=unclassified Okeania TaxID=2634635 RepID=UPI0013B6AB78|nr:MULTISPECIES: DUF6798 domain-containing protein [unclassified Okeania]NEP73355.1 hypothetical protein [Okeania sp. SIO2G5]NEP94562.1 hypothetical protein [Okeania sp. SIO2F5]NEQ92755.1 hypothetical protein [Okeania sp. SIO2G4]
MVKINTLKDKILNPIAQIFILGLIFGISYTQDPLYTSNQHTKFLQGLAKADLGYLNQDWLANRLDPLPAFTFLVQITYTYFHENFFYFYYILIFGIYIYSMLGIASVIFKINTSRLKLLIYFLLLLTIHCLQIRIFDFKTHVHLHYGLAEQYILGGYFQPCTFGVLIIFSIYAFLRKKPFLAVLALGIAATFHPTYFPSAALLTLAYLILTYKNENNLKKSLLIAVVSFISVLPVVSYMTITFRPTSPELFQISESLLVNRIPHHSFPDIWLTEPAAPIQILVVVIALYLLRKTRLFFILFLPFATATILTIIQIISVSNTLAFLTPWRVSAFLVPISTCMISAYIVAVIFDRYYPQIMKYKKTLEIGSLVGIYLFILSGVGIQLEKLTINQKDTPIIMEYVKENKQAGDIYLVPYASGKFVDFRIATGAPILINLKSHPYKDTEVIEWHNRLLMAQQFYDNFAIAKCQALQNLIDKYQITHIIIKNDDSIQCSGVERTYIDNLYKMYQIIEK